MSMRISELARTTGVALPTVKYYLREGLLPAGRATAATQAEYDESHVARLRLVRALVEVGGLSLAAVRAVLETLDAAGPGSLHHAIGQAHSALGRPPQTGQNATEEPHRAATLLGDLGWRYDPSGAATRQLEAALAALEDVCLPPSADRLRTYADAALAVATSDVDDVPTSTEGEAVAFVVLGTVLYEPVLLALRRLAQAHVYTRRHPPPGPPADLSDATVP